MADFILAIDQGTTGTTVLLVSEDGSVRGRGYREFAQLYPRSGWVEHDPEAIWQSTCDAIQEALETTGTRGSQIAAIGITNQRETTLLWERDSLKPVHNAIVWQCRRTAPECQRLKERDLEKVFQSRTGLVLDPYFSGTKLAWLLREVPGVASLAQRGKLAFGTVDSYLVARLTGGRQHITDVSNASRTLLMNLETLTWDDELAQLLEVPTAVLPRITGNAETVGTTADLDVLPDGIPISGLAGDQQAALFGQVCFAPGEAKCTYGTGAFMLANIGTSPIASQHGLLTTVAWKIDDQPAYAFEGSAFIAGAAVQWVRDELDMISASPEIEPLAASVPDSGGAVFVPALTGLGAPHWNPDARGALLGLSRGTTKAHFARAVLEGIALQNHDIMQAMQEELGNPLKVVRVDGGAAANNLLMQLQADLLQTTIRRPAQVETTGLGAAFLAGLGAGFWADTGDLRKAWKLDREFVPEMDDSTREQLLSQWHTAVGKA